MDITYVPDPHKADGKPVATGGSGGDTGSSYSSTAALTSGQDHVIVTGLALSFVPTGCKMDIIKPSGGYNISAFPSSVTADGFRADFSGIPTSGYVLSYTLSA